jgi:hypothetical protein
MKKNLLILLIIVGVAAPTKPISIGPVVQYTDMLISELYDVLIDLFYEERDELNTVRLCSSDTPDEECFQMLIAAIEARTLPGLEKIVAEEHHRIEMVLCFIYLATDNHEKLRSKVELIGPHLDSGRLDTEDLEVGYAISILSWCRLGEFQWAKDLADEFIEAGVSTNDGIIHLFRGIANYELGYAEDACSDWMYASGKVSEKSGISWYPAALSDAACPFDEAEISDNSNSIAGLSDFDDSADAVIAYPNPSSGIFQVKGSGTITIQNSRGELILTKSISGHSTIDLSRYANGFYILQLQTEKGMVTRKLIKE